MAVVNLADGIRSLHTRIASPPFLLRRPVITAAMENKLLAYQFALCLIIEKYACEVEPIAADLTMPVAK